MQDIGSSTASSAIGQAVYRQVNVTQMDRNDNRIRTYTLYDAWPTALEAIDLAFDTNDAVEEFGATFRFNYMTATGHSVSKTSSRVQGRVTTEAELGTARDTA